MVICAHGRECLGRVRFLGIEPLLKKCLEATELTFSSSTLEMFVCSVVLLNSVLSLFWQREETSLSKLAPLSSTFARYDDV